MEEKEKNLFFKYVLGHAENISKYYISGESIVKKELIVMGFEPTPTKWLDIDCWLKLFTLTHSRSS